jgi:RNA polymerase sigma factor (sigma-70 family)
MSGSRDEGAGNPSDKRMWDPTKSEEHHFIDWYDYVRPHLVDVVRKMVSNQDDVEDLVQEVSAKLWDQRHKPQTVSFCKQKAVFCVRDFWRKRNRESSLCESELEGGSESLSLEDIISCVAADQSMDYMLAELTDGLGWLTTAHPDYAAVLVLTVLSRYSDEDAAEALSISVGALRTRRSRAIRVLRDWLRDVKGWKL